MVYLDIPASSMRGMGYSSTPTIAMLLGIVGVRLLVYWNDLEDGSDIGKFYLCFPISWVITLGHPVCTMEDFSIEDSVRAIDPAMPDFSLINIVE
jgi:hypothetical protein